MFQVYKKSQHELTHSQTKRQNISNIIYIDNTKIMLQIQKKIIVIL